MQLKLLHEPLGASPFDFGLPDSLPSSSESTINRRVVRIFRCFSRCLGRIFLPL